MIKINIITVSILTSVYSHMSMAALDSEPEYTSLNEVEVWSEPFAQKMGTQKINSEAIEELPTGNGTISELLKSNPNVQFSSNSSVSEAQGEIAPENVSIHGERFYNNNWQLDGMSNNDNINPGSNNGSLSVIDAQKPYLLPDGGTQSFWINSDLIDSVDVYDSNIPAKYGRFTGGVIDAKLKDPDTYEGTGRIGYRITRDEWTEFHFEDEERKESFEDAGAIYDQPQFTKQIYSINVNQPLSDSAALLFSYNRTESVIPFHHTKIAPDLWEDQTRLSETFLLKGLYEADSGDTWKLTSMYSPHEGGYAFNNVKNGGYKNLGGGYRINADWLHIFNAGIVTSYLGYKETANDVEYQEDDAYTWTLTPSIDWSSSDDSAIEGGYGQSVSEKNSVSIKQDYELDQINLFDTPNKISFGWSAELAQASYSRKTDTTYYISTGSLVPSICYPGDKSCITGEQAADIAVLYPTSYTEVSNDHYASYLQDQIQWRKFEFTPGVRVDYDEFMGNIDIAPRLTVSYDLFTNGDTVFFGGLNRYYSDSLLAYALSDKMGQTIRYSRDDYDAGWIPESESTVGGTYTVSDLKTPHSDEINIGVSQRIKNTEWTVKWVNRKGRNQFMKETDIDSSNHKFYRLTNNGYSEADSFTLSGKLIEPIITEMTRFNASIGANYIDNKSNFTSYDPSSEISDIYRYFVDGDIVTFDELKTRNDFNQPWTLFTKLELEVPDWGIMWTQAYRYASGYSQYIDSDENYNCSSDDIKCGEFAGDADIYKKIKFKDRLVADWRVSYEAPIYDNTLVVSIDILNVFNERVEGSSITPGQTSVSYKPGRSFWLNGQYNW
jgi:hypothetical protein